MSQPEAEKVTSETPRAGTSRPTPTLASLPSELKALTTSYLDRRDVASLSTACRSWSAVAEIHLWRHVDIIPVALRDIGVGGPRDRFVERPTLSRAIAEMLIRHVQESWGAINLGLTRRPNRLALVKSMHFIATSTFWSDIMTVVPLVAPNLTELELIDAFYPQMGGGCAFDVIDILRNLPALRILHIDLPTEWYVRLLSVLRAAPNLEELSISVEMQQRNAPPPPEDDVLPELPRLRKFSMNPCEGLFAFLPRLAKKAPHLHHLEAIGYEYALSDSHIKCIKPFLNLETLRITDPCIFQNGNARFDHWDKANKEDILPKLHTLVLTVSLTSGLEQSSDSNRTAVLYLVTPGWSGFPSRFRMKTIGRGSRLERFPRIQRPGS
jgi:hypothetical protein